MRGLIVVSSAGLSAAAVLLMLASPAVLMEGPIRVVDGDTIVRDAVRYRLQDFDAPEISHARCAAERSYGRYVKARVEERLRAARRVHLLRSGRLEKYGRVLARLVLDGRDIAPLMIEATWGVPYRRGQPKHDWCIPLP